MITQSDKNLTWKFRTVKLDLTRSADKRIKNRPECYFVQMSEICFLQINYRVEANP